MSQFDETTIKNFCLSDFPLDCGKFFQTKEESPFYFGKWHNSI